MDSRTNASGIEADTIVIGAGPAGLGAALALGDCAIVLESRETVAGLCGTVALDGAIFDLGGHSFKHAASRHSSPCIRCLGNGGAEPRRVVLAERRVGALSVPAAFFRTCRF